MYFNRLSSPSLSSNMQSVFLGLNKGARIAENEFASMHNMSGDLYPLISPRGERVVAMRQLTETVTETDEEGNEVTTEKELHLGGILGDVGFCAVWGNSLYYMGEKVEGLELSEGDKNLVAMGGNILIFPDAAYYNTVNGESGFINADEKQNNKVHITLAGRFDISNTTTFPCEIAYDWLGTVEKDVRFLWSRSGTGAGYNSWVVKDCPSEFKLAANQFVSYSSTYAVIGRKDGYMYYCSKATVKREKRGDYYNYLFTDCEWVKIEVTSFKIKANEMTELGFDDSDIDNIWCDNTKVNIEKDEDGNYLVKNERIADAIDLQRVGYYSPSSGKGKHLYDDIGTGLMRKGAWRVRTIPILDFVCVHGNRLWGCRYGAQITSDSDKEAVNEIYASELGDFKKWVFAGEDTTLAGSAYAASVGDYGPFTGCISHRGYVLFFKEDVIYRVSGTKPANFQISNVSTSGVQKGSERSLAIIDEVLFYKAKNGIYAYDGSLPQKVSTPLGDGYYTDAVGGALLSKYYVSMVQGGERMLYVFDTSKGLWHTEDSADVRYLTEFDGALYAAVGEEIWCLSGMVADIFEGSREGDFDWHCTSGDIGLSQPFEKYFHRLLVRMEIERGARVRVEIAADSGEFLLSGDYTAPGRANVTLPVVTPRCDRMRVRISGRGKAKIYSIYFEVERGN